MTHLKLRDFASPGQACHFALARITDRRPAKVHDHDFLEVFWVESKTGWHWINGAKRPLRRGQVVFVRASDAHSFTSAGDEPLLFYNLAFRATHWKTLWRRYELTDVFAPGPREPRESMLSTTAWGDVQNAATDLRAGRR